MSRVKSFFDYEWAPEINHTQIFIQSQLVQNPDNEEQGKKIKNQKSHTHGKNAIRLNKMNGCEYKLSHGRVNGGNSGMVNSFQKF